MSHEMPPYSSRQLVELLRTPAAYPDKPRAVDVIETHISWVFLTDQHVYKLKKPVKFDFVDFSNAELRRLACENEVRLNRRLAPDVYLAVVPVTMGEDDRLRLNGSGTAVDWLVQMRRLPAEQAMDCLLRAGRFGQDEARQVTRVLANFYSQCDIVRLDPDDYRATLRQHISANRATILETSQIASSVVERVHDAQIRFLSLRRSALDARVSAGRVVDGHGDLRPEHIYMLPSSPVIIDCIEFSDVLRRVDIADELAFLAMECHALGSSEIGDEILDVYQDTSHDRIEPAVSAFYRSYRACVRAKVKLLTANQQTEPNRSQSHDSGKQYLELADRYAAQLGKPFVLISFGLMGTGKSTLAARLAESLLASVVSTDRVRRSLLGESATPSGYGKGIYGEESRAHIYQEVLARADELLRSGRSVILDGTFSTKRWRQAARELAERHASELLLVLCECPPEVAKSRIERRRLSGHSESEARADLYEQQANKFEAPDDDVFRVDTTTDAREQVRVVCDTLGERMFHERR